MNSWRIGVFLLIAGLALNQFGFLHDVIWDKHDGAIFMGAKSYSLVLAGFVAMIGGYALVRRSAGS